MRILIAHVDYRHAGGEESVVETEGRILREAGHEVEMLRPQSRSFDDISVIGQVRIGMSGGEHRHGRDLISERITEFEPDVVHFHNLYPLLGVGAMREAGRRRCGVVQTLHNHRLTCIAGTHLRKSATCDSCNADRRMAGVVHRCYRHSFMQSGAMALALHRQWSAMPDVPDVLLTLTRFSAERLIAAGIPAEKIILKPNSVDVGAGGPFSSRAGAICIARLSAEKGALPLATAWPESAPTLTIVGTGPQEADLVEIASRKSNVVLTGRLSAAAVRERLRTARVTLLPSPGYEGMPLSVLESFSEGTPVLFLGVRQRMELAGESMSGEETIEAMIGSARRLHDNESEWTQRSTEALRRYEARFSHEANMKALESAYSTALVLRSTRRMPATSS